MNLKKGLFSIPTSDPDNYGVYEGYTYGETWNGFEMPYFDKATAIRILTEGGFDVKVSGDAIGYFDTNYEGEFESIPIDLHEFNGEPITLYDMSLGWVWEKEEIIFKEGDKARFYPEYADGDNGEFICLEDSDGDRVKVIFPNASLTFWHTEVVNIDTIYKV